MTTKPMKRGFTVLELLIVIAVILSLAGILFPVFARARENARRSSCQSNLKQIGIGLMQYIRNYDELFPPTRTIINGVATGWAEAIQPYVKSIGIYQCPSETAALATNPATPGYTDYFYNNALSAVNASKLNLISRTITTGDGATGTARYYNEGCGDNTACGPAAPGPAVLSAGHRHLEGANYGFADAHVKWYKAETATSSRRISNGVTPATAASMSFGF